MSWREDEESVRGREISERVVRCNILMSISVVTLYFRARLPLRVRIRVNVDSYEKGFFFPLSLLFYRCLSRMEGWKWKKVVSGNIGIDCLPWKHTWLPVFDLLKFWKHFFPPTKTIVLFLLFEQALALPVCNANLFFNPPPPPVELKLKFFFALIPKN